MLRHDVVLVEAKGFVLGEREGRAGIGGQPVEALFHGGPYDSAPARDSGQWLVDSGPCGEKPTGKGHALRQAQGERRGGATVDSARGPLLRYDYRTGGAPRNPIARP